MITAAQAVVGSLLTCIAGAGVALLASRRRTLAGWLTCAATAASSAFALYAAGVALAAGGTQPEEFLRVAPLGLAFRVHVDGLAAVFLGLIAIIAPPAALFSLDYLKHYEDYSVARFHPYFLLFLAGMYGLVSTTDLMCLFFLFWQLMTLSAYALIRFEYRKPEKIRAAYRYLVMMQLSCAARMIGVGLLAATGATGAGGEGFRYDFATLSANLPGVLRAEPATAALAFALVLIGLGINMGMWPFGQLWLPHAHPAAPSSLSALHSGVMLKMGVYGLLRHFLWLVPTGSQSAFPMAAWGLVIAACGTVTLFTGTAQAFRQEQTKRLLAFHSIGQIGYILLAVGTCLAILPSSDWGLVSLAALAFYGALFHTVNHGLFKSLLFLNAGSILKATDTQNLNELGGLMRFMPVTAVTALVASFSISGVPLFNGFASKWCIFTAAVHGGSVTGPDHAWILKCLPVFAIVAIFASALTLASFIKFFGSCFLGRTSERVSEKAGHRAFEIGWTVRLPQLFLAVLCMGAGLIPMVAFRLMDLVLNASRQGLGAMLAQTTPVTVGTAGAILGWQEGSVFGPVLLGTVLGLLFLLALGLARVTHVRRRSSLPWCCGCAREAGQYRYGAHHYYGELKRRFRWLGGAPPVPARRQTGEP